MSAERVSVRSVAVGDVVNFSAGSAEDPDKVGVWRLVRAVELSGSGRTVVAADANGTDATFKVLGTRGYVWRHLVEQP